MRAYMQLMQGFLSIPISQFSSRFESNGALVCTWSGIPRNSSKLSIETFANYRFLPRSSRCGNLHGNYFLLCCLINLLLPFLSKFWATTLSAEMIVCLEEGLKRRANPVLGAFLDHSSCMMLPIIVRSKWKSQGSTEKKIGWLLKAIALCFFSTPACSETQNPANFRKGGFLVLWPQFTLQLTILVLLIPWNTTVFCSISTDNSSSTCGVEEREGFFTVSFFHIPLIHWDKLGPLLSFTNLFYHICPLTSFPCKYFATQNNRPTTILSLQSWPLWCF